MAQGTAGFTSLALDEAKWPTTPVKERRSTSERREKTKCFIVFQFARLTVKTHRAMDLASPLENGFVWVCLAHRGDRIAPIFAVLSHDFGGLKHVTSFDFDNFSGLWDENNDCKTN